MVGYYIGNDNTCTEIASLEKLENIFDMCEFIITGDILPRKNTSSVFGNVTMFDNYNSNQIKKSKCENIFHILALDEKFSQI